MGVLAVQFNPVIVVVVAIKLRVVFAPMVSVPAPCSIPVTVTVGRVLVTDALIETAPPNVKVPL